MDAPRELTERIDRMSPHLKRKCYTLSEWTSEVGLCYSDVARGIGVTRQWLQRITSGQNNASKRVLDGIYKLTRGKVVTKADIVN